MSTKSASGLNDDDVRAIRAIAGAIDSAWSAGDVAGLFDNYSEDATTVNPFGESFDNRADLTKALAKVLLEGAARGTTHQQTIESIRPLGEGLALVDGFTILDGFKDPTGRPLPARRILFTAVASNASGRWRYQHFRGYVRLPPPGQTSP